VTLARPKQNTLPSLGTKCGRRERESRREGRREKSLRDFPSRVVTEQGIPVFRKVALFAGRHRNEGLGRLGLGCRGFLRGSRTRRRQRMSEGRRGGERRRLTHSRRRHRAQARDIVACASGRVLRSVLRPVLVNPHYAPSGKTAVVGRSRRHRGWASLRKQEEPAPGSSRRTWRGSPRTTARESGVVRKEKEGGRGRRPCEGKRAQVWLPARPECSCRSR